MQATPVNFTPLDSSRQRASFQINFFSQKNFFNFRRFLAQKKLLDGEESNGAKFIALSRLITELWPIEMSKL
jgi:hypothetical protein